MKNGETKISDLFSTRTIFSIPEYQRSYSWEKQQLSDFVKDIENQKKDRSYFFGTVLFEEKGQEGNYDIIDIVDGQQRITTIIMFMAVLILQLKKISSEENLEDIEILSESYIKHKQQYRLRVLEEDNDFFHTYILKDSGSGSEFVKTPAQKRLVKAKKYFKKYLSNLTLNKLLETKQKIDQNMRVLVYSVKDTAEATLIFETTNDRGKGLTNLEKIKSFMMYQCYIAAEKTPEELLKKIRSRFSAIYKEYEKYENILDEDSILQYHFIGHFKSWNAKEFQQHVMKIKEHVNSLITSEKNNAALKFIDDYTTQLKETFFTVSSLLSSKNKSLRNIFILSRTRNFWPLLIKAYNHDETIKKTKFSRISQLLEIYSFRIYAVNASRANTGQSKFYKFAQSFSGNYVELEKSLEETILEYSTDRKFKNYLSSANIYERMDKGDLNYFFWKYENFLRTTKQPKSASMSEEEFFSKNSKYKLTIEHIASQKPKKSIIKNEAILSEISEEFKEYYLHSIGNLTIDPKSSNSSKGNKEFDDKNEKYFRKAPFKIQNELDEFLNNGSWSIKSIKKRKKVLIKFALQQWAVDIDRIDT